MIKTLLNIQMFGEPKNFIANIEDVLKKHTSDDGVVDYTKANEEIGLQVKNYTNKNIPKMEDLKAEAAELATKDFINGLNIEGVDDVDKFVAWKNKMSSEDWQVKLTNQDKAYKDLESKYNELNTNYAQSSEKLTKYEREQFLLSKNAKIDDVDYLSFKISQLVTDDVTFETAYEEYAKNNPKYFNLQDEVQTKTTGKPRVSQQGESYIDPIEAALRRQGKIK